MTWLLTRSCLSKVQGQLYSFNDHPAAQVMSLGMGTYINRYSCNKFPAALVTPCLWFCSFNSNEDTGHWDLGHTRGKFQFHYCGIFISSPIDNVEPK